MAPVPGPASMKNQRFVSALDVEMPLELPALCQPARREGQGSAASSGGAFPVLPVPALQLRIRALPNAKGTVSPPV